MSAADHTGYGLKDGELRFIADVPSGLACECVCAQCGQRLVAKKGRIRQHHFAHFEDTACHGAAESALHLLAKELLTELQSFTVPPYKYDRQRQTRFGMPIRHAAVIAPVRTILINRVRVEEHSGDFIPDIVIESTTTSLIVEIAVSHKVDSIKLRKLRRRNLPAIEIQLDGSDSFLPRHELKQKLWQDLACKKWLFHPDQRAAERTFFSLYRRALALFRRRPATIVISSSYRTRSVARRNATRYSAYTSDWWAQNEFGEQFSRRHGRYPSLKECQNLMPDLFAKKAT